MSKAIFARAGDIYLPFTAVDVRLLRRFVRQVDRLRSFSFFEHPSHRMRARLTGGMVVDVRADAPSDEAISAVMPPFRELYNVQSQTSADQVLRLLSRNLSPRESPDRDQAVDDLRSLRRDIKWRRQTDPRGVIFEEQSDGTTIARTPASVIDTWLNGEYFHFDEPKAAELVEGHPATEMLKAALLSAIHDFANIWAHVRNAAFVAVRDSPRD